MIRVLSPVTAILASAAVASALGGGCVGTHSAADLFAGGPTLLETGERWFTGTLAEANGPLAYALVFVLAAIPWLEILLVIPAGIAVGLDPLLVGVLAFLGNALPIYGIVVATDSVTGWLDERRPGDRSNRRQRAVSVWNRWGMPGLALCSPILTGVHLGAVIALGLGASRRNTLVWMVGSIAVWTIVITVISITGVSLLRR